MSSSTAPEKVLGRRGRRLWDSVVSRDGLDLELDEHEQVLLVEACRTVDLIDQLDAAVRRDGPLVESPQGVKAHPAAVEVRQQRIALARLMGVLRLPAGEQDAVKKPSQGPSGRPQRRVGARGVYAVGGA